MESLTLEAQVLTARNTVTVKCHCERGVASECGSIHWPATMQSYPLVKCNMKFSYSSPIYIVLNAVLLDIP